jgi:glycosyltransferase involved in cell wall biosynthesis
MCKAATAIARLGHQPVLIVPRKHLFRRESEEEFKKILHDFAVPGVFRLIGLPRPVLFNRGHRAFSLLSALYAKRKSLDYVWTQDVLAADFTSKLGIPTILELHVLLSFRQLATLKKILPRSSFRCFVANSEIHRTALVREQQLPGEKIFAAHAAVDLAEFRMNGNRNQLRAKIGLADSRLVVAYSGSLYRGRGIEEIIEAAKTLNNLFFLCIGGREEEADRFRNCVNGLKLNNVKFTGYVPHSDLPSYLAAADILVAPYRIDCEAIDGQRTIAYAAPMKLPEYMAAGKPIISSRIGAIPEIIEDRKSGILIEPGNVAELVFELQRLSGDEALRQRLGTEARRIAEENTWEWRVERILKFAGIYP